MNRRRLIKLAALSLAGLGLPLTWLAHLRADTLFSELYGDPSHAAEIGRIGLSQGSSSVADSRQLIAALANCHPTTQVRMLKGQIGRDLEALDLVVVDGWIMARTEADLCAAVHLDRTHA